MKMLFAIFLAASLASPLASAASLGEEIARLQDRFFETRNNAEFLYKQGIANAEALYGAALARARGDAAADQLNSAVIARNARLEVAYSEYVRVVNAAGAEYVNAANSACVRVTGVSCRWK